METVTRWNQKQIPREFMNDLKDASLEMKAQKQNSGSFNDVYPFPNIALKSINICFAWLGTMR